MVAHGSRYRERISTPQLSKDNWNVLQTVAGKMFCYVGGKWVPSNPQNEKLRTAYVPAIWYNAAEATWDDLHPGPPWKSGGPFSSIKVSFPYNQVLQGTGWYTSRDLTYANPFYGSVPHGYLGGFGAPSFVGDAYEDSYGDLKKMLSPTFLMPDLSPWGPEAWARSAPKIEMASGFVFLAEGRDIPRMLKTSSKNFHDIWKTMGGSGTGTIMQPKKIADAYLNHEFGWSPFLSDIAKFYNAYQNTAQYMSRMSHGNDQWKVYRRTLLDDFKSTIVASGTGWRIQPTGYVFQQMLTKNPNPPYVVREDKYTLVTTSGSFKWYKPEFDLTDTENYNSAWDRINRQLTMYGARISPSNVWRATPWTWLADWGLNVGRNIDRLTEYIQDGVVAKYLYVMEHSIRRLTFTTVLDNWGVPLPLSFSRVIEVKTREPASSPYGFSLPWSQLDARKLAILAALGISRH